MTPSSQDDLRFTRFLTLESLLEVLDENPYAFDAMVVEQSVFEEADVSALGKLNRYLTIVPSIVLTLEKSDFSALSYLERGFSDCVTAGSVTVTHLSAPSVRPWCADDALCCNH